MNLILTVLEIVAPVFLVAALGFGWVKLGFEYRIQFVTQLGVNVAVPCLIFTSLMKSQAEPGTLLSLTLAGLAAYGAITLVGWGLMCAAGLDLRTYLAPFIFGNTGNLGLPLALFAFGQSGLEHGIVILALTAILSFTLGLWLVAGKGSARRILREPMVWATLLGALFLWQGWETPDFLTDTIGLIGQMAIPLMLLTLGVAVARLTPGGVVTAVWLSVAKLILCTALGWGIGLTFGLTGVAFGVLVLQMATPVGISSYLLAEKFNADSASVAGFAVVSTLVSVVGLPIILAILL
ncbi:AEC family transporter [Shimia abyssi]|uniref:Auxin efflux carrier n=1 Tax=Shimia abyssi TaxID=1662395 RepID=A0A2P8FHW4_9RHOB|nr:AEC family transporter [Shimia abyssi]PSL21298.1 hypothetical protein CLV88_102418 [Shimia abyssi]